MQSRDGAAVTTDPLLRTFFEHAPFGLALVGADRKLVHVNPALVKLLGFSEAELRERTWDSLTHPDDAGANLQLFEELRAGQRDGYVFEKRYLRRDGSPVWVKVTASLTKTTTGTWLLGVIEDISDLVAARRQRELAVTELSRKVRALRVLHSTLVASRSGSLDTLLETIAAGLPEAFETPVGVTVRLGARRVEGGVRGGRPVLVTSFNTGAGELGALELESTDPLRPVSEHERALLDSVAELLRGELERRHATTRAQAQHERLEHALARADMGVWEYDVPAGEVTLSEHLSVPLGVKGELRQPYDDTGKRMPPEDRWVVRERVAALLRAPPPASQLRVEFKLEPPVAGWRRVSAVGKLLRDAAGRPTRLLAVLANVTHQRALEDDQRHKQKLSVLAQMSQSVVRELDEVVEQMQRGVQQVRAHLAPGDPALELVTELEAATQRGTALTQRLRRFGTDEGGAPARIDLAEVVRSLTSLLARVAGERITLVPKLVEGAVVEADRNALERALLNLVVNARDATQAAGQVTLELSVGDDVVLTVEDEGTGMPPEVVARVAEPFFTTKREGHGTGLGVPVVYDAVERAGGRVVVSSAVGRGTRFELHFPRAR